MRLKRRIQRQGSAIERSLASTRTKLTISIPSRRPIAPPPSLGTNIPHAAVNIFGSGGSAGMSIGDSVRIALNMSRERSFNTEAERLRRILPVNKKVYLKITFNGNEVTSTSVYDPSEDQLQSLRQFSKTPNSVTRAVENTPSSNRRHEREFREHFEREMRRAPRADFDVTPIDRGRIDRISRTA